MKAHVKNSSWLSMFHVSAERQIAINSFVDPESLSASSTLAKRRFLCLPFYVFLFTGPLKVALTITGNASVKPDIVSSINLLSCTHTIG
jgi:hypothetical protein